MNAETLYFKTMLGDVPIERAIALVCNSNKAADWNHEFQSTAQWNKEKYTLSQLSILFDKYNSLENVPQNIFTHLLTISEKFLVPEGDSLAIKVEELLRWRELTRFIGEDIVTCSYCIQNRSTIKNIDFQWPDVLPIEQCEKTTFITGVTNKELADVHCHLLASSNIADIIWIYLMNYPDDIGGVKMFYENQSHPNKRYTVTQWSSSNLMPKERVQIAAAIRVTLYRWVCLNEPIDEAIFGFINSWNEFSAMCPSIYKSIKRDIDSCKYGGAKLRDLDLVWDYAIDTPNDLQKSSTPYGVLYGERKLIYSSLLLLKGRNDAKKSKCVSKLLYLYILIKANIRQEFLNENECDGLANFQHFDVLKNGILDTKLFARYAIQTSIRKGVSDRMEARVNYSGKQQSDYKSIDWSESIIQDGEPYNSQGIEQGLTFVLGLSKTTNNGAYYTRVNKNKEWVEFAVDEIDRGAKKYVGIDALGSELRCRPEAFSYAFRYAQDKGVKTLTYHVGEDFYDIIDGIRAIDEAIFFLNLGKGMRIGHGLALGIDAKSYYEKKGYNVVIPLQYHVDNLAWMLHELYTKDRYLCFWKKAAIKLLKDDYKRWIPELLEQYNELKLAATLRAEVVNWNVYYQSMLLRGLYLETGSLQDIDRRFVESDKGLKDAYDKKVPRDLLVCYTKYSQRKNAKSIVVKWPKEILRIVRYMQKRVLGKIVDRHIGIETCPSSNLSIGPFDRYDELPLIHIASLKSIWHYFCRNLSINPKPKLSINTDDKGIFATSLQNEYAYIGVAMLKRGIPKRKIKSWLEEVRMNGINQVF